MQAPIYLDYNATTPTAPEVVDAMLPFLHEEFGNPSSHHVHGDRARQAVAVARAEVAALLGTHPEEIVFTGSATEANNLALLGVARAQPDKRHLLLSAIEHPAVMEPARNLGSRGWEITILPVDGTGRVDPAAVAAALRPDTALVSVMQANNEIGTLQPIAEIAALAHAQGSLMHTDAAQSAGKIPVNVARLDVDLLTLAGHKFHAPKGVGALFVRAGTPLQPILFGGSQERGLRPGTENVPYLVALGAAATLARKRLPDLSLRLTRQRERLHHLLDQAIPGLKLNGHPEQRLPNTLHLSFPGVTGLALLAGTPSVAASLGSACHASDAVSSGVLGAIGLDQARAAGAIRLSLGAGTQDDEIEAAAAALSATWRRLVSG
jgi:cysteine desulfurase